LREVEDRSIAEAIRLQEEVGLQSITDGEHRRTYFHIDFLEQLSGVKTDVPVTVKKPDGSEELAPPVMRVVDKVRHHKDIQVADFRYLKSQTLRTPKVTIPSPTMLHFRGGRAGISATHYPELEPYFYEDVAEAYGAELRALAAAGATYVQMDDTNLAYLCDEKLREGARQRAAAPLRHVHQSCRGQEATRHDPRRPSLPRQLQEHLGRHRRLRTGGGSAAVRDERRCLFSRIR
jgi:5-methyltetrahydropteroyltriglutamate--homocysteine methyltransferase